MRRDDDDDDGGGDDAAADDDDDDDDICILNQIILIKVWNYNEMKNQSIKWNKKIINLIIISNKNDDRLLMGSDFRKSPGRLIDTSVQVDINS